MIKYLPWIQKHKDWIYFALFFAIVLTFHSCQKRSSGTASNPVRTTESADGIDLLIPEGQSLVPIEVVNYETLDSLLGPYGVVDLFYADPERPEVSKKIASMVKILRAPKNPSHFAVLVPSRLALHILRSKGPFIVSVQNPKFQTGTHFEKRTPKRSRIIYE